jgi:hypothetical protein
MQLLSNSESVFVRVERVRRPRNIYLIGPYSNEPTLLREIAKNVKGRKQAFPVSATSGTQSFFLSPTKSINVQSTLRSIDRAPCVFKPLSGVRQIGPSFGCETCWRIFDPDQFGHAAIDSGTWQEYRSIALDFR